jgi:probable O-glycosylation ligase (exosortase A-associated)
MRDYLFIGFIIANLPIGFIRPYYGMLVYTWLSYMYPQSFTWSIAQSFPAAKLSAIATVAGTLITQAGETAALLQREIIMMVLFWCTMTISSIDPLTPAYAWIKWQDVSKIIIMGLLAATLLTSYQRVRWFLLLIGLSLGFYGFKGGIFSFVTGGEFIVWGPENSILRANNAIGLALNMCLPILWYLAHGERGYLRIVLYVMFFASIPSIMFTYSRASGLVTLPVVLLAIMLKGRTRWLLVCVLLLATLLAIPYVPKRWWDRQQTTFTYESDQSAMSRIDNWRFCWRVALARPVTGAGFGFYTRDTFAKYAPEFLLRYGKGPDSHSIYLGVLAAHGFPGLITFLSMIALCLFSCRRMERVARHRSDLTWLANYSSMIQISLLALLVNGAFVNMEYFDLLYHFVGVVASLKVICYRALSAEEEKLSLANEPVLATS